MCFCNDEGSIYKQGSDGGGGGGGGDGWEDITGECLFNGSAYSESSQFGESRILINRSLKLLYAFVSRSSGNDPYAGNIPQTTFEVKLPDDVTTKKIPQGFAIFRNAGTPIQNGNIVISGQTSGNFGNLGGGGHKLNFIPSSDNSHRNYSFGLFLLQ